MRSDVQAKIGDAIASLTARLDAWQVPDPSIKAHEFVNDMLRNGWRPAAPAIATPTRPDPAHDTTTWVEQARAAIRTSKEHA